MDPGSRSFKKAPGLPLHFRTSVGAQQFDIGIEKAVSFELSAFGLRHLIQLKAES
jgi:hypothetical protein